MAEAQKQGLIIDEFSDVKKWWKNAEPTDENIRKVWDIVYEPFTAGWDRELEIEFMRISKWEYDQESKEEAERCARARCKGRVNLNIKGCVQQTISYLKTDLCNQIRDAGKFSAHGTNITKSRPIEESRKLNGKYKKLKKGEYTVTQWTKKHSELEEPNPNEQDDFIQDNIGYGVMESSDILQNDIAEVITEDINVSHQATDLEVSQTIMKENTPMKKKETKKKNQPKKKKIEAKKKKNQPKKKIEKKKCITPVSSPEFIHVPSTAEKRRDAKVARNQQFLRERGLDLSISELSKLYNNNNSKKSKETYYVEKILNHRKNKYKTGEYEVEIKWKDYGMESNTWEDMREKILEVPDNFLEYYNTVSVQSKKDFETYLQLYPELQKVFHQAKKSTTPLPEKVQNNDSCNFDHKELKNYISETNPSFCKKDFYLNGKMCSGKCMGLFDEINKGVVEGQLWIKPSVKAPVWVCQGLVNKSNCCQALCSQCAKVMMSSGLLV